MHRLKVFTLLFVLQFAFGQSKKKLLAWINEGKAAFEQKAFLRAASHFQKVINAGKKGLYEEAALYLAGLSYYYAKDYPTAISYFQHLLDYYPNSGYAPWAKYHKGLSMLENPNKKEGGYYVLLRLYEEAGDAGLKDRIKNSVSYYWLKKEPLSFLRAYRLKVRKSFKPLLYEILAYRLYENKDYKAVRNLIKEARKEGISSGKLTKLERTLDSVKTSVATPSGSYDTLRITVLLPFFATSQATSLEKRSVPATEFLAGMEVALQKYYPAAPKIKLQVLDTWKDKQRLQKLLNNEVKNFNPHIIIGELYRKNSEELARLTKGQNYAVLVPFVNRKLLFEINPNVFLQNPSLFKQGQSVARYVTENQNKKKLLVIFDNKEKNYEYKEGIIDGLRQAQGVDYSTFTLVGSDLKARTEELYNRLKTATEEGIEAIFFVSDSYDLSEFFISKLAILDENAEVLIIGHPKWYFFNKLNKVILAERKSVIPGTYEPVNDPAEYSWFKNKYSMLFNKNVPPFYAVQGYDAIRMICYAYAKVNEWENNKDIFAKAESKKGIAQNYYWGNANSNQSVILLQYTPTGFTPLYLWKK